MTRSAATPTRKSEETRNRILEAALALFRERGFEKTTMREIAQESDVALGAAYYYFDSKDALVMGFYERAQHDLAPLLEDALARTRGRGLEEHLQAAIDVKFQYFAPNRKLLGALSAHIDPQHPLSPFSEETRAIRERDIAFLSAAIEESKVRIPADLKTHLPRLLWLYQMGLMLFWVYDRSSDQKRTRELFHKSLSIVVKLVRFSGLPLMRPVRKLATDLLDIVYREQEPSSHKASS
jgi:AcrR family transcriptional regulator